MFFKQDPVLRISSTAEIFFFYSLAVGAMFIGLYCESSVVSFLTIPPITKIKYVSQLAVAEANGEYHCITYQEKDINELLLGSKREDLRIIGRHLQHNNIDEDDLYNFLYSDRGKKNLAFLAKSEILEIHMVGDKIVSEDHFFENMAEMMIQKKVCCKDLVETFVHRLMASGL